jgi:Protein of unknown function (DUF3180)
MNKPTSLRDLLIPLIVVAAVAYVLLKVTYGSLPPFQWYAAVPVVALAVAEFVIGRRVRRAVRHDPAAKPMSAFAVARSVALGKASALVGAGAIGAASALVAIVLPDVGRTVAAGHDLRVGLVLMGSAAVLAAAGITLERAGLDPNRER